MTLNEQLFELKEIIEDNYEYLKKNDERIAAIYEALEELLSFSYSDSIKKSWLKSNEKLIISIKNKYS